MDQSNSANVSNLNNIEFNPTRMVDSNSNTTMTIVPLAIHENANETSFEVSTKNISKKII